MNGTKKIKYSRTDQIILGIAYVFLGVFVLSILIPLIYVVLASFMDPTVLNNQGLSFHIKDWTLDAYRRVLENDMIWFHQLQVQQYLSCSRLALLFEFFFVFNCIYRDLRLCNFTCSVSDVKKGICRKKIL